MNSLVPIPPDLVLSIGSGLVLGITSAAVLIVTQHALVTRMTPTASITMLATLYGFAVVLLLAVLASPIAPRPLYLVATAAGTLVIAYLGEVGLPIMQRKLESLGEKGSKRPFPV